jgi:hypothetical protein
MGKVLLALPVLYWCFTGAVLGQKEVGTRFTCFAGEKKKFKKKVHKLNEMGKIVDKEGHSAWEMACGLRVGIRVMVGMNNHTLSKIKEPDFEMFEEVVMLPLPPLH